MGELSLSELSLSEFVGVVEHGGRRRRESRWVGEGRGGGAESEVVVLMRSNETDRFSVYFFGFAMEG